MIGPLSRTNLARKAGAGATAIAATALLGALAACGGGGGGGGGTFPAPTPAPTAVPACLRTSDVASSALSIGALSLAHPRGVQRHTLPAEQPGTLAVRFANGKISASAAAALARLGAHQSTDLNPQGAATFSIPSGVDARAAGATLRAVAGVLSSGPVVLRSKMATPNDTLFNSINQWGLFKIQMPAAWDVSQGSTAVHVAVLDTGFDAFNTDLAAKVDGCAIFDLKNGIANSGGSIEDKDGHGSNVSGIAAAATNNGSEVAGVGWNVHLLEVKVFDTATPSPHAASNDIAAGINWAVAHGAKVINLSLGSSDPDPTFEEPAVAAAIAAGVTVVAAAGNDGTNTISYPAHDPGVIAVGASAFRDVSANTLAGGFEYVAPYSNFGAELALVAPGGDPDSFQQTCAPNGTTCPDFLQWIENLDSTKGPFRSPIALFAGTSQAAPHVAGAVALMISKDPTLTPAQVLSILKANADDIGDVMHQGAGRLNVLKALNATP
ncbi:MAG: S8 family serine peptidase [Candidatus Eremiobacter antarcticus]|nr:S8 family serine peptidase [Candidatus Eremiobacteraeota bacterium]MBC5808945.1 S8 family serine peptidase [Candidatus Eremiobacteraeota bacterium]